MNTNYPADNNNLVDTEKDILEILKAIQGTHQPILENVTVLA